MFQRRHLVFESCAAILFLSLGLLPRGPKWGVLPTAPPFLLFWVRRNCPRADWNSRGTTYGESDWMRDVTPIVHNCNRTQWKGLNIKSDNVNVDVLNRRLFTQLPKVALDYEVVLSRYCRTRKFFSNLRCVETCSHTYKHGF